MAPMTDTFDFGDNVDKDTFDQILEMDDEDDDSHDFSKGIVFDFFNQAQNTFEKMHELIRAEDLDGLSGLGHFLKGSSATLGLTHMKDACEKIQNYGKMKDATGTNDLTDRKECLQNIKACVSDAERSYSICKRLMEKFYDQAEA